MRVQGAHHHRGDGGASLAQRASPRTRVGHHGGAWCGRKACCDAIHRLNEVAVPHCNAVCCAVQASPCCGTGRPTRTRSTWAACRGRPSLWARSTSAGSRCASMHVHVGGAGCFVGRGGQAKTVGLRASAFCSVLWFFVGAATARSFGQQEATALGALGCIHEKEWGGLGGDKRGPRHEQRLPGEVLP